MKHKELSDAIIKAFFKVYNKLGYGFLEKVYENALHIELTAMEFSVERQKMFLVYYDKHVVGNYYPDIIVEDTIICELKASESLQEEDERQLINYLKATDVEIGLLLNFGKKPTVKRKVYDNIKKPWNIADSTGEK